MSKGDSILKDIEAFLMEHGIASKHQDLGLAVCANQIIVIMPKHMLKNQMLEA